MPNSTLDPSHKLDADTAEAPHTSHQSEDATEKAETLTRNRSSRAPVDAPRTDCSTDDRRLRTASNGDVEESQDDDEARRFEVCWDEKNDPLNPKNMKNAKKWMVVLFLSAGSTCA